MKPLSRHLQQCITRWDQENELDDPDAFEMYSKVLSALVSCLESFTESNLAELHGIFNERENLGLVLDQYYARKSVQDVPSIVNRLMNLDPAVVRVVRNKDVTIYVGEATRCFVHGFHQASIALCRAAIDIALGDSIKSRLLVEPKRGLGDRIKQAQKEKLVTPGAARLAETIKEAGDKVVHREPQNEKLALAVLRDAREALASLYS